MADSHEREVPASPIEKFGQLIRDRRQAHGWTQDDLAERSGVGRVSIIRLEAGKLRAPEPGIVRSLCVALGIDPRRGAVAVGYLTESDLSPDDTLVNELNRAALGAGATIRAARIKLGWSPQHLADRAEVDVEYVNAIEAGTVRYADPEHVRPIFAALNIPRIQLAAVGQDEDAPIPGRRNIDQVLELLESPSIPDATKLAAIDYLRYLRAVLEARGPSATERFSAAIGKPHPAPLTPDELAEFEREMDELDAAVASRYTGKRRVDTPPFSRRLTA
ncbi:helix-turn-helix domain-containing protein [Verrucosispora sp. NA02020]|uniref:helix-turn-helix domain-containing protein n=1 Tax=Verrucosispora sp. NA02020 TaxID=2742132 RepID=UPI001590EB84|nr:helix-turn-helix domain-containing protein [Verrucosispora sp. NA02020]QKW15454.1 helix-turn-helix domain-containing protein [Verrucosispora sp. NA02020]